MRPARTTQPILHATNTTASSRPVMCVFGWLQFGEEISNINAFGIALASAGSLIYAQVKRMEAKRLASSP